MADARANLFNRASRDDEILKRRIFPDEAPDLVRMNVLVTEEQKRFLKIRAAATGESVSSWLRSAIEAEIARSKDTL